MHMDRIINSVTELIYQNEPALFDRYGEKGKAKCKEDNHHHFKHLHTAYELADSQFFIDYAIWLNGILTKHGMETRHLTDNFSIIHEVLDQPELNQEDEIIAYLSYLEEAVQVLLLNEETKGAI
ncbi:hypothetical protein CUU66_11870 [Peribacillus deserti]|uniref:DUF1878 domain-containing protein n=2 Tax=Peribacillus deserti TaxID=673318 RepID=A0A2N5M5N3_9BACI|nr:hypothetical protein CUU66_11870 [Peribacillus deserti]